MRQLTPAAVSTAYVAAITVGDTTDNWSVTTRAWQLRIFMTSGQYNGNLGGLTGANSICQTEAGVLGYAGTWKSVLSDDSTDAVNRITMVYPIVRANSTTTVVESTNFWNGSLDAAITTISQDAWTGSNAAGVKATNTCNSWTDASTGFQGASGWSTQLDAKFLSNSNVNCNLMKYLYCIEQ